MMALRVGDAVVFAPDPMSLLELIDKTSPDAPSWQPVNEEDAAIVANVLAQVGVP